MYQAFIISLITILNFILQSTVIHHFSILGVLPNTALIIVVCIALLKGKRAGSIVGLVAGLLQDIIFSPTIGVNALVYFFIGYIVGMNEQKISKDNLFIPFIFTALMTLVYHVCYFVLIYFLTIKVSLSSFFKSVVFIELIYNSLLAIPIYKWFSTIFIVPSITFRRR